jgi:TolA-binding protein
MAAAPPRIEPLAAPEPVAQPEPAVPAAPAALAPRREIRRPSPRPPVQPAAPPAEAPASASTLAEESQLLESALRKLRQQHDGAGALATLDEYRARFPRGELGREAERTRVEALLATGRTRPALEALDAMALGSSARDVELLVARGELRAHAARCADAEADFGVALARAPAGALAERALYGRASCRSRRGDRAGARADLGDYLARFPNGRFASDAKRGLANM